MSTPFIAGNDCIKNGVSIWLNEIAEYRNTDVYLVGNCLLFVCCQPQYGDFPYADISIDNLIAAHLRICSNEDYDVLVIPITDCVFNSSAKEKLASHLEMLKASATGPVPSLEN